MADEFCPRCGTQRLETFRYCRGCQFDFEGIGSDAPSNTRPSAPVPQATANPIVESDRATPPAGAEVLREVTPVESSPSPLGPPKARQGLSPNSASLRTILLGIVLAILVVPFGGEATVPGLLIIAALVILDLWWQRRRMEAMQAGVPQPTPSEIEARLARGRMIGLVVLGVLILSLVIAYFAFSVGR